MKSYLEQDCVRNNEGERDTTALNNSGSLWLKCTFCIVCSSGHCLQKDTVQLEETQKRSQGHSSLLRDYWTAQTCLCCQHEKLQFKTQANKEKDQRRKKMWDLVRNIASLSISVRHVPLNGKQKRNSKKKLVTPLLVWRIGNPTEMQAWLPQAQTCKAEAATATQHTYFCFPKDTVEFSVLGLRPHATQLLLMTA